MLLIPVEVLLCGKRVRTEEADSLAADQYKTRALCCG